MIVPISGYPGYYEEGVGEDLPPPRKSLASNGALRGIYKVELITMVECLRLCEVEKWSVYIPPPVQGFELRNIHSEMACSSMLMVLIKKEYY